MTPLHSIIIICLYSSVLFCSAVQRKLCQLPAVLHLQQLSIIWKKISVSLFFTQLSLFWHIYRNYYFFFKYYIFLLFLYVQIVILKIMYKGKENSYDISTCRFNQFYFAYQLFLVHFTGESHGVFFCLQTLCKKVFLFLIWESWEVWSHIHTHTHSPQSHTLIIHC